MPGNIDIEANDTHRLKFRDGFLRESADLNDYKVFVDRHEKIMKAQAAGYKDLIAELGFIKHGNFFGNEPNVFLNDLFDVRENASHQLDDAKTARRNAMINLQEAERKLRNWSRRYPNAAGSEFTNLQNECDSCRLLVNRARARVNAWEMTKRDLDEKIANTRVNITRHDKLVRDLTKLGIDVDYEVSQLNFNGIPQSKEDVSVDIENEGESKIIGLNITEDEIRSALRTGGMWNYQVENAIAKIKARFSTNHEKISSNELKDILRSCVNTNKTANSALTKLTDVHGIQYNVSMPLPDQAEARQSTAQEARQSTAQPTARATVLRPVEVRDVTGYSSLGDLGGIRERHLHYRGIRPEAYTHLMQWQDRNSDFSPLIDSITSRLTNSAVDFAKSGSPWVLTNDRFNPAGYQSVDLRDAVDLSVNRDKPIQTHEDVATAMLPYQLAAANPPFTLSQPQVVCHALRSESLRAFFHVDKDDCPKDDQIMAYIAEKHPAGVGQVESVGVLCASPYYYQDYGIYKLLITIQPGQGFLYTDHHTGEVIFPPGCLDVTEIDEARKIICVSFNDPIMARQGTPELPSLVSDDVPQRSAKDGFRIGKSFLTDNWPEAESLHLRRTRPDLSPHAAFTVAPRERGALAPVAGAAVGTPAPSGEVDPLLTPPGAPVPDAFASGL